MMKISIDNWEKNIENGLKDIHLSSEIEAENYLKTLNQQERTSLSITSSDEKMCLLIGGGLDNFVVNIIVGNDDAFYNLLNVTMLDSQEYVEVTTGGQVGLFEQKYVVDFISAKKALIYFVNNEQPDPSLNWEEEIFY